MDKFGRAAGPLGSYYTTAIKGVDSALSQTGRELVDDTLGSIQFLCTCGGSDWIGNRDDFVLNFNRLRQQLN